MYEGISVYYYENGQPITGWKEYLNPSNGVNETYYFGDDGAAVSGWQTIGGKLYYFDTPGCYSANMLTHGARTNVGTPGSNGGLCDYVFDHGVPLSIEPGSVQMSTGEKCYYVSKGKLAQGWQTIEDKDYYFGAKVHEPYWSSPCYMVTGSVYLPEYEGAYLFGADGVWYSRPGWAQLPTGEHCYVDQDGKLALGLNRIDGKYYRFAINTDQTYEIWYPGWGRLDQTYPIGALMTGKYEAWGKYLADEYGVVQVGWKTIEGNTYYFGESIAGAEGDKLAYGECATGWMTIGGRVYYFSNDGVMLTGKQESRGREQPGDPYRNGVYLFGDGSYAQDSWQPIDNEWYHFDSRGYMQVGWLPLGGVWYYLGSSGAMHTGWLYDGGVWYYLNGGGDMATGWQSLGGTWYYLDGSGAMQVGWLRNGGAWYYLNGGGDMATGWRRVGGAWYFLNPSGDMATGWEQIGGAWYYLSGSGDMAENRWAGDYWLGSDGAMATNARR